jgi:hypothetical protein
MPDHIQSIRTQVDEAASGPRLGYGNLLAAAQSAYRQSQGKDPGTICRPARITEGRKILGKVFRNAPMPKFDPNN